MVKENTFEVRVSRWLLLLIILVGLLFLLVGWDLTFSHIVFDRGMGNDSPILTWAFRVFALAIGVIIIVTQGYNLIIPPVMMRVSQEGISFGTGARYTPRVIPLKYLRSVETYQEESMLELMGRRRIVEGGVALQFERAGDIPSGLATSAGVMYSDYCLRLRKAYMNRSPQQTVEAVKGFVRGRR